MNMFMAIYFAILFFILSPGVLLRIPKNGSKFVVAGVHAVVFGVVAFFTGKFVWNLSQKVASPVKKEGLKDKTKEGLLENPPIVQVTRPQLAQ
jgi:hypothetical protein